jgi:hypothetical protein
LPRLSTSEVADVLQVVRVRVLRALVRRGVLQADAEGTHPDDDLARREPALAQLAATAVAAVAPAAPALRRHPIVLALRGHPGSMILAPLCVQDQGFTLHAATRAAAADTRGREALIRYVLRPPIAQERVRPGPDGLVRIELKKPFADGTWAVDLDPLSLLCRLAAATPPPRLHTIHYFGVLAPAARWRPLVVPTPAPAPVENGRQAETPDSPHPSRAPRTRAVLRRACVHLRGGLARPRLWPLISLLRRSAATHVFH